MPPLPSPGRVLKVDFTISDSSSIQASSRFFLEYTGGPPNTTDLNTLSTAVAAAWVSNMATYTHSSDHLVAVEITDLLSPTGAVGTWTGSDAGTSGGNQLTASVCAVINHAISRRYRGGRPRTYVRMGASTNLTGQNEWNPTAITNFKAAWQAWVAAILATTGLSITLTNVVNVSYYAGFTVFTSPSGRARNIPTPRVTPLLDNITNSSVSPKLGSQRRRLNI